MANEIKEIVEITNAWTPEVIVNLIKEIIWPITVLLLGWHFRGNISNIISNFFTKNNITELNASPTGISAKFKTTQQNAETNERITNSPSSLPENLDFDSIKAKHLEFTTEYSKEIYLNIKKHIDILNINDKQKIDLLETEVALIQSSLRYYDINKVLFRSQFDLFNDYFYGKGEVTIEQIKQYYNLINYKFVDWDYAKYMAFPISTGIVESSTNGYKLTKMGISYIKFMRRNLQLVNELSSL
jgi:hypothetical protein